MLFVTRFKKMLLCVLILAASSTGVYSQRCATQIYQPSPEQCYPYIARRDPYESTPILPRERNYYQQAVMPNTAVPVATVIETPTYQYCPGTNNILPCDGYYAPPIATPAAMPIAVAIETAMPVMSFITDLPNCPDICLNEILTSPLGCLDPILNIYSANNVCPLPDLPVSPLLSPTSPLSILATSCSRLVPPVCDCDYFGSYLKREPIPPPFI